MALLHLRKINYFKLNVCFFYGFFLSLLNGIYNTCAIHTQVNKQASVARILFAGFFGIFSTSINEILLDAQIKDYNTKLSTKPKLYDDSQNTTNTTPTASQLQTISHNYPYSLVPRNFRIIALTEHISIFSRYSYPQHPITHILTQPPNIDETYEPIIEQPLTTNFRSRKNHLFHPR